MLFAREANRLPNINNILFFSRQNMTAGVISVIETQNKILMIESLFIKKGQLNPVRLFLIWQVLSGRCHRLRCPLSTVSCWLVHLMVRHIV